MALLQEALGPLCLPAGSVWQPWLPLAYGHVPSLCLQGHVGSLLMGPFPSSARSCPSLFTRTLVQLDSGPPFSSTTSPQLHLQQPYFQTRSRSQIWSLDSDMFWGNTVPAPPGPKQNFYISEAVGPGHPSPGQRPDTQLR